MVSLSAVFGMWGNSWNRNCKDVPMKDKANLLKAAAREKRFSTLAKKEAKGNSILMDKAKGANEKDLAWEVMVDKKFANVRAKKAKEDKRKAKS